MPKTSKPRGKKAPITVILPALAKGEYYAGIVMAGGKPSHHLILLPGYNELPWAKAVEWAKKQGGDLPNRQEAALLYANCKPNVEAGWYWTGEQRAANPSFAWVQSFRGGGQGNVHEGLGCRVRAVRRVVIQ